jgi:uncharacterized protein YqjF (DUF2071 family)
METPESNFTSLQASCDDAKRRLLAGRGDPLVQVRWNRVLFIQYRIPPEIVRPHIPECFEVELHEGNACLTLAAVTMQRFRRHPQGPCWGGLLRPLREQRFLNVRTYVRYGWEPGVYFLWGWLSRPWGLPLPDRPLGLHCSFGSLIFDHRLKEGELNGSVGTGQGRLSYRGAISSHSYSFAAEGSLSRFALERYSGFYWHRGAGYVFRAWHEPWQLASVKVTMDEDSLLLHAFPWTRDAAFAEARFAMDLDPVWLGRPHRLPDTQQRSPRTAAGTFDTMP